MRGAAGQSDVSIVARQNEALLEILKILNNEAGGQIHRLQCTAARPMFEASTKLHCQVSGKKIMLITIL